VKGFLQIFKLSFSYRKTAISVIFYNILFVIFNLISLVLFVPFLQLIFDPEKQDELKLATTSRLGNQGIAF
jgi:subfamily B ATP-binding cassette protein MsbA